MRVSINNTFSLITIVLFSACLKASEVEQKCPVNSLKKSLISTITINGKNREIISYFNLTKNSQLKVALARALSPSKLVYDMRGLEIAYCNAAQNTTPLHKLHRGSLGFVVGAVIMGLFMKREEIGTYFGLTKEQIKSE